MGTAGPSGFHSANTHGEPRGKAGQIHRLGARGFTDRERKSREGRGNGRNGGRWGGGGRGAIERKGRDRERTETRRKAPKEEMPWETLLTRN